MSTTLALSGVKVYVPWQFENALSWANATNSYSYSFTKSFTNGTTADKCDLIYITQSTLAASATTNLDLAGALTDMYGNTITFARVKLIYFELQTTTTSSGVHIGGASSAGFANWISSAGTFGTDQPKVLVRNGGVFFLCAPDATAYAVTATTADILKLTNADGSNVATYRMVIAGASA